MLPRTSPALSLLCALIALGGCGAEKATEPVPPPPVPPVGDRSPPTVEWLNGPATVSPGTVVEFRFRARDSTGVTRAAIYFGGAFEYADSAEFDESWRDVIVTWPVWVPNEAVIDGVATAVVLVADSAGFTASAATIVAIKDIHRPRTSLDLGGLRGDETIRPGETLDLYVNAADNHGLRYIGYYGGGLRDSVPATSVGDSHVFQLTVPASWRQQRPEFTAWARDGSGNVSERTDFNVRTIPVYEWTERPVQMIGLNDVANPFWFLHDAKRDVAYVAQWPQAGGLQLGIVNLSTGTWGTPIPLPEHPFGLNFSTTNDSLVMSLPQSRALGIVDLRQSVRSVDTIPLQPQDGLIEFPVDVQVSGTHLFVSLLTGGGAFTGRLLDVDLATGAQVIRRDIDGSPNIPRDAILFRLPDSRMFVSAGGNHYWERFLYSPVSDTFIRSFRLEPAGHGQYSPSPSGRFLLGSIVYDAALNRIDSVTTPEWKGGGAALSPDGSVVYLSTHYGYAKIRLSDGAILEQVKLGTTPGRMIVTPDGSRLIMVATRPGNSDGELAIILVDLR